MEIEEVKAVLVHEVDSLEQYIHDQHQLLQNYYFEVQQSQNANPSNPSTDSHIRGRFENIIGRAYEIRDPRGLTTVAELRRALQSTEIPWTQEAIDEFRGYIVDIRSEVDTYVAQYKKENPLIER